MEIEINKQGYCKDCYANHNCNNCDIAYSFFKRMIIKKLDEKKQLNEYFCICGNKKSKNSLMCKECYDRYKLNKEFF